MNIALFGNPNTGKTSLFNILTGSYAYVGNWTGVTVEKKVGLMKGKWAQLIDLPGVYSLAPISKDEGVATHFLLHDSFDTILNIVDASGIERNLQLTLQLLEYGKPVFVAMNMIDVAKGRGIDIDIKKMADRLQTFVAPIIARTGSGCTELVTQMRKASLATATNRKPLYIHYGLELEEFIQK